MKQKPTGEKHQPQRKTVKEGAREFRGGTKGEREVGSRILNDKKNDPLPPIPPKRSAKKSPAKSPSALRTGPKTAAKRSHKVKK